MVQQIDDAEPHRHASAARAGRRGTPIWIVFTACVAVWWAWGWTFLRAEDVGYEMVPPIIAGPLLFLCLALTCELIGKVSRRIWRRPDFWIDPAIPGTARTWALTASVAAALTIGGVLLINGPRRGTLEAIAGAGNGWGLITAFVVWLRFTPEPEPRACGFFYLWAIALLGASAAYTIMVLLQPALVTQLLASIDATGVFVQALIAGPSRAGS